MRNFTHLTLLKSPFPPVFFLFFRSTSWHLKFLIRKFKQRFNFSLNNLISFAGWNITSFQLLSGYRIVKNPRGKKGDCVHLHPSNVKGKGIKGKVPNKTNKNKTKIARLLKLKNELGSVFNRDACVTETKRVKFLALPKLLPCSLVHWQLRRTHFKELADHEKSRLTTDLDVMLHFSVYNNEQEWESF